MPVEIFMVPMIGTGTRADPFRPKYSNDPAVSSSGAIRSSKADECIAMFNATQLYLDSVAAQTDTLRVATGANIDSTLTLAQANAAKTFLENRNIPGEFANQGDTRRQVIRGVVGMFLFCQRMEGKFGVGFKKRAIDAGITFSTQFVDFPQAVKDEFLAVRDDHGWDNMGLTNASTLRQILIRVAQQFEKTPIVIAGYTI